MQLDRLTQRLQEAFVAAQDDARAAGNPEITTEHLAQALLRQEGGLLPNLLGRLGVDVPSTMRRVEEAAGRLARVSGGAEPRIGREATRANLGSRSYPLTILSPPSSGASARWLRCSSAARMKPRNSGWQSMGRDLNSGWNCEAMNHG